MQATTRCVCVSPFTHCCHFGPPVPPSAQVAELLASVRRLVHALWSRHLAMGDGFEEDINAVLQLRWGRGIEPGCLGLELARRG